jgi:hypothetical protein
MNLNRPFVEVAKLNKPLESDTEKDAITAVLRQSFSAFKPLRWRIYQSSHLEYKFASCEGDKRYLLGQLELEFRVHKHEELRNEERNC